MFPSLLLLLTLFRLSLNLASSRRILLHGNEGAAAAGKVIEAFGQFVVGGNYVVGFVIFLALIAIQYIVVSHGAVRTAEVTARFTLDAMPGKQMAIDADLNAGLIDEAQARARREQIARDAEFYGAMDGAARFNQRDALATILITAVNIIAGFLIGVFQLDIPFREALKTYTVLTVGDGLVTMIPSLLVSMAGGMVVTRASSDTTLSADLGRQLFSRRRPLLIAAGVMLTLAAIPGLPKFSFLLLAALAWHFWPGARPKPAGRAAAAPTARCRAKTRSRRGDSSKICSSSMNSASKSATRWCRWWTASRAASCWRGFEPCASNLAQQLGFIVPPVHITDNARLKPREYVISLRGVEIARWEMLQDQLLAISSDALPPPLAGTPTREPAFGVAAVVDSLPALQNRGAGHRLCGRRPDFGAGHAPGRGHQAARPELLTRQEAKRLLDRLAESHPKLVEELVPKLLSLGEVQKVLQQLAARAGLDPRSARHSRDSARHRRRQQNPVLLVEAVRQSLGRALVRPLLAETGGCAWSRSTTRIEEELGRAFSASLLGERSRRAAAPVGAPHARRPAAAGRGTGRGGQPGAAVLDPGAFSPEAPAGTFPAQAGRAFAGRNSSRWSRCSRWGCCDEGERPAQERGGAQAANDLNVYRK